ncbi:MAG: MFS transporter [Candidatus Nezhaarchaeota archaeon]|nr:MFS transporter [Candidatus Nezhaarchaeota archaeon]
MKSRDAKRVLALLSLMICHQLYAADQYIVGAVLLDMMRELSLTIFWGGAIATLFSLGIVVSSMLASWIIRGIGLLNTLLISLFAFSSFTVLTGLSTSAVDASICRVCVGLGQGAWNVAYYSVFGILYPKSRGLMSGVAGNMFILGILWSYPTASLLLSLSGSWRLPFYVFGFSGVVMAAPLLLTVKPGISEDVKQGTDGRMKKAELLKLLMDRNMASSCALSFFAAVGFGTITSLYPTYLREVLKYGEVLSSAMTSVQMCLTLVAAPVVLSLSDKHGRKPFLYLSSVWVAPLVYLMFRPEIGSPHVTALLCSIYGVLNSGGYPLLLSYIQDLVPVGLIPLATSICTTAYYAGLLASGPIMGSLVALVGWENASFWLIFCYLAYFAAALIVKETRGRTAPVT